MSYISKFVAAVIGLLLMAIVASSQLFLFAGFRDLRGLSNSQAGKYHLWLAFSAGIGACVAGGFMFYFYLRYERNAWTTAPVAPLRSPVPAVSNNLLANSPTRTPFDPIRWAQQNPWLSEGQADDRTPMNGSVGDAGRAPSDQRAFARRSHQAMFKKWSQARHD